MKWILILVFATSHQIGPGTSLAVDHIELNTEAACIELRDKMQEKPKGGGLLGAINGAINSPIITARCESVDDSAAE